MAAPAHMLNAYSMTDSISDNSLLSLSLLLPNAGWGEGGGGGQGLGQPVIHAQGGER